MKPVKWFKKNPLRHTRNCTQETTIQNHFKSHMPELMFIGTVSSQKLLEIGMHSLHMLYPLLKVLRIASLDSHHWWDLGTSPLPRWPCWMNVCWHVASEIFWFWSDPLSCLFFIVLMVIYIPYLCLITPIKDPCAYHCSLLIQANCDGV